MPPSQTAIAIIQARMSSSRLPCKMLMPLGHKPMLWHVVQRAKSCNNLDHVIVATSTHPSDDAISRFCDDNDITCLRGSLSNVLGRFIDVINEFSCDHIVRVTGDCPLIDPNFIDFQISLAQSYKADIIQLDERSTILEGQGVHSTRSIREVFLKSTDPEDLEHVGSRYLIQNRDRFKVIGIKLPTKYYDTRLRLTVDEMRDYEAMSKIYEQLWTPEMIIPLEDVLHFLKENPDILKLNQFVTHNKVTEELNSKKHQDMRHVSSWHKWNGSS